MMVDLYGTCYFDKCSAQFWFNFLYIFEALSEEMGSRYMDQKNQIGTALHRDEQ